MKPKVCYILTHDPDTIGGIETVVKNLANGSGVRWLGCGGACSIIKGFIAALKLRFSDYDIIHGHDNAGYWLTRLAGNKKLIWTAQGLLKNYFEENPPLGWKKAAEARILLRMQDRLIKKSDVVVPINHAIKDSLQRDYKIQPFEVIHNGVDTKTFRPLKIKKRFDYIWVSTNPKKARLKESIEFAAGRSLLAVGIDGKGTEKIKYIKAPREAMPKLYNSAKTLIYFSKQPDYSIVILEAMACGLNIIANEAIMKELTSSAKPTGSINLDGREIRIVFLSGKNARKIATTMDWSSVRARYKKIYENLYLQKKR